MIRVFPVSFSVPAELLCFFRTAPDELIPALQAFFRGQVFLFFIRKLYAGVVGQFLIEPPVEVGLIGPVGLDPFPFLREPLQGQAIKAANLVGSGVEAKFVIQDGLVKVNGQVELQRGKKLVDGDIVEFEGYTIKIEK